MRRRLWWQIIILDGRAAEDRGMASILDEQKAGGEELWEETAGGKARVDWIGNMAKLGQKFDFWCKEAATLRAYKGTPLQSGNTKSQSNGSNGSSSQEEILGLKASEAALYGMGMGMRDDDILKTTEVRVLFFSGSRPRNPTGSIGLKSVRIRLLKLEQPSLSAARAPHRAANNSNLRSFPSPSLKPNGLGHKESSGLQATSPGVSKTPEPAFGTLSTLPLMTLEAAFRQLKEQHHQPNKGSKSSPKKRGATNTGEDNTPPKKKRAPAKSKTTAKALDGASKTVSTDKKKLSTPGRPTNSENTATESNSSGTDSPSTPEAQDFREPKTPKTPKEAFHSRELQEKNGEIVSADVRRIELYLCVYGQTEIICSKKADP
ncbi:MAG: hypothetical protein Q9221_002626 [Calogaya cf. arnoldii]